MPQRMSAGEKIDRLATALTAQAEALTAQTTALTAQKTDLTELKGYVSSLAASVVHHDDQIEAITNQIGALIKVAEKHSEQIADLGRQWQA